MQLPGVDPKEHGAALEDRAPGREVPGRPWGGAVQTGASSMECLEILSADGFQKKKLKTPKNSKNSKKSKKSKNSKNPKNPKDPKNSKIPKIPKNPKFQKF